MKIKKILTEIMVSSSVLALLGCLTLTLANSTRIKGIVSFDFSYQEDSIGNLLKIVTVDFENIIGKVGFWGVMLSLISLFTIFALTFLCAKKKWYFIGVVNIVTLILITIVNFLPSNNIFNLIVSFFVLLFVNPFYTLLTILPFSVIISYGIITAVIVAITIICAISNKLHGVVD